MELSLYYSRNPYAYTIRYEVKDTGAVLATFTEDDGQNPLTGLYGDTVSATGAPTYTYQNIQYSLSDTTKEKNVTIGTDESQNVIIFYYEPTKTALKITNSGLPNGCEDVFLYQLRGPMELVDTENCITLIVAVKGSGAAVIGDPEHNVGLYAGTYEVTPLTDWSYRYSLDSVANGTKVADAPGVYSILLTKPEAYTMTFDYTHIGSDWLGGETYRDNEMEYTP